MKKIVNQHGDVVLETVMSIPEGAVKLKTSDGFVVEKGEGIHTHILRKKLTCCKERKNPLSLKDVSNDFEIWAINDTMFIKVLRGEEVILDHEEHGKQILKEGIYKKNIEREYDYLANEERRVMD